MDVSDDAKALADALIIRTDPRSDFFDSLAVELLQGLILYVVCHADNNKKHLGYVRELLTESPEEFEDTLLAMSASSEADGLIRRAATKFQSLGNRVGPDVTRCNLNCC